MPGKVFIIGAGIISALGEGLPETLEALSTGRSGIRRLANFETGLPEAPLVGEVPFTNVALAEKLGLAPSEEHSRTFLLGLLAARQAVQNAGIDAASLSHAHFISSTTVGGMDHTESFLKPWISGGLPDDLAISNHHDCGAAAELISRSLGMHGFITTINTACSSAANAMMLGARMIAAGHADIVMAGGSDPLSNFTINGFNSLMLLSEAPCKPFDRDRNGLNLGEAAAYLILCSESVAAKYAPIAMLAGWANTNDAYHQTASSPEGKGAAQAMRQALKVAGSHPSQVDYINAHGTATPNNDQAEMAAIAEIFGTDIPPYSSTKSFTGHTLAAAGAIEAVFSVLAIRNHLIFPNLNYTSAMEPGIRQPATNLENAAVNTVVSNSFGFGGNCTSLVFKSVTA